MMSVYYFTSQPQKFHGHRTIVLTIFVSILVHSAILYKLNYYDAALWQDHLRPPQTIQPVKMSLLVPMNPASVPKVIPQKKPAVVQEKPKPLPEKVAEITKAVDMPVDDPVQMVEEKIIDEHIEEAEEVIKGEVVEATDTLADDDFPVENLTKVETEQSQSQDSITTTAELSATTLQATTNNYFLMIQHMIESRKHYPQVARRRRIEGEVEVSFVIRDDGTIDEVSSSGNQKVLNSAAEKAVFAVSPLPKPPEVIAAPLQLSFTMIFKLI